VEGILSLSCGPFHSHLCSLIQSLSERKRLLLLAPRNSGKSTLCSVAYSLWKVLKDRDTRCIIVANTSSQAQEWLRQIEQQMLYNEVLRELFGNLVPPQRSGTWNDTEKIVEGRSPRATHLTFLALGYGGALLGRRADLIVVDDIVDFENSITEGSRARLKAWFWETLVPVLEPDGEILVVGTRWAENDLYAELLRTWKGNSFVFRAINEGKSYWPERWPLRKLKELEKLMGSLFFNCQFQNKPFTSGERIFRPSLLHLQTELSDAPFFVGVDPCISQSSKDYFVAVVLAHSRKEKKFLIYDMVRRRASVQQQLEVIKHLNQEYQPRLIGIESNAAQSFLAQLAKGEGLPIRPLPSQERKEARFYRLLPLFESGKLLFRGSEGELVASLRPLRDELLSFPDGEHDDTIDALVKAVEVSSYPGSPTASVAISPEMVYNLKSEWFPASRGYFGERSFPRRRDFLSLPPPVIP